MARPKRIGIDYFPIDIDIFDDEKVIPISSDFGAEGECVLIRVLCAIYREGYFVECSEAFLYKIAKQSGVAHSLVAQVIDGLAKWGFFDKNLFSSFGVLTSEGIQRRWKEATRKRVKNHLPYWLLDGEKIVSGGRNPHKEEFLPEEIPITQPETPQSKLNKSKYSPSLRSGESSDARAELAPPTPPPEKSLRPPRCADDPELLAYFARIVDPAFRSELVAADFFDHFGSQGWVKSSGMPITNWQSRASSWVRDTFFGANKQKNQKRYAKNPEQFERRTDRLGVVGNSVDTGKILATTAGYFDSASGEDVPLPVPSPRAGRENAVP